jgi:hypothetical protein
MTTASTHPLDRIVDVLIDRKHPFWKDERNAAIYNEAASAALVLQTFLIVIIGGIGLLFAGKAAVGIITAMVLTVTVGQALIFGVLLRRHVEIDVKTWQKQSTMRRRIVSGGLALFYLACCLWAQFHQTKIGKLDASSIAGMVTGAAFAVGLFVLVGWASRRALKKRQAQAEAE